jgi:acyl-CoA thioester hydrolase
VEELHGNPFSYCLRVRFQECDGQRVVFNSRYGDFIDLAVGEYVRTIGVLHPELADPFDYQLVKQMVEWKRPARFDDVLDVRVRTLSVGNTSFQVECAIYRVGEESRLCRAETVYVLMDTDHTSKRAIPESLRAGLLAGAPGYRVDHADCTPRLYG